MARYKWASPYEWLAEKIRDEWTPDEVAMALLQLAQSTDSDTLQDHFQSDMDADGYFHDTALVSALTREQCVGLLESVSIECRDDETVETLREAVAANIEDNTLAYSEVEEVVND